MTVQASRVNSGTLLTNALVAGVIGAVLIDAFLVIFGHAPVPGMYQFVASTIVGAVAFTSTAYVALGLSIHLVTSLVWAVLYAYVWRATNRLSNWVLGGVAWGVVVNVCMDIILASRGSLGPVTPTSIVMGLIAHIVFFGLPVAWWLSRTARAV